jgi:MraZ protein
VGVAGILWNLIPKNDTFDTQSTMPETAPEITYESTFTQRLDEKRRVPVPHRWRSGKSEDFHLMIWPKHKAGTCLRVLAPGLMTKLRQKLDALPDDNPKKAVLKRQIGSRTMTVTVDNAGRITIPEDMIAAADLKTDAVFVGMLDRFEIWNPARHAQMQALDNAVFTDALDMME